MKSEAKKAGAKQKIRIVYVTSSEYKQQENEVFVKHCMLDADNKVRDIFEFDIRRVPIQEILNVDLKVMVSAEAVSAYSQVKVPCIVEHAGLVFSDYRDVSYPGGLTKPMWDTLKDRFVDETKSAGRRAIARAVIAYCDGMTVQTFVGERTGRIADKPFGKREFYWDTVFIPDDPSGRTEGMTYAQIAENPSLGLRYKITELSQSSVAMKKFLNHRFQVGEADLWR